jgi:hypothetical protein
MQCSIDAALIKSPPQPVAAELGTLRRRLNWLVDQVGNHTGRPTKAQTEWIGIFDTQLNELLAETSK